MSKPFGKRPVDWLRLQITLEYIEALFKVRENHFDPPMILTLKNQIFMVLLSLREEVQIHVRGFMKMWQ